MDPLSHLAAHSDLAPLIDEATAEIQAVHRRPVSARKSRITSSEGILRGARLAALLGNFPENHVVDAYSILAPNLREQTARTFSKAPLQIFAKLDVLLGGSGQPINSEAAARLNLLGHVITVKPHEAIIPAVVQGEVAAHQLFGPRSGIIGLAAARVSAVASGFDPLGLTVPEVYFHRHQAEFVEKRAEFGTNAVPFIALYLAAMRAGAAEAAGIATAAQQSGGCF